MECKSCSFIFSAPKIESAKQLELEHYSNVFSEATNSGFDGAFIYEKGLKIIKKHKFSGRFLDVGAGRGEVIILARGLGFNADGIEPSLKSCAYAKRTYNIELAKGELDRHWPWPNEKFDVVSLFHVLEHVADPRISLRVIKSRLSKRGILYIEVPNGSATLLKIADLFYYVIGKGWSTRLSPVHPPFHSVAFSANSLVYLLKSEGYAIHELGTFANPGRCRGALSVANSTLAYVRNFVSFILSLFPNREILYVVASSTEE